MFAIFNAIFSTIGPFISITVSLSIAFTVIIWFTLSMIYALSEIINFLLGQPLVGWLVTGDINTSNNLSILLQKGAFKFDAPLMIFIYTAMIMSLFIFIIYFFWSAGPFNSKARGSLTTRGIGILMILLTIVWLPTIYFVLVIATSGFLMMLSTLLAMKKAQNFTEQINLMDLKNSVISNLEKFKDLKNKLGFNFIDLESQEIKDFINQTFDSSTTSIFSLFTNLWNDQMSDRFLTIEKIDQWVILINNIKIDNLKELILTTEQRNQLFELARFSNGLNQLNQYYESLKKFFYDDTVYDRFNNIFLVIKNNSLPNLSNFKINEQIFSLNTLNNDFKISNFAFLLTDKASVFNTSFSQSLVNILYSLALGEKSVFVPGWESGWNIIGTIPSSIASPISNVTANLFYNVKMLAIGGIVNAVVLPSLMIFTFLLLKRFIYIAFWPLMILFRLAKTGMGDINLVKDGFNQLVNKFLSIIVIALMWNFITVITVLIFDGLQQLTFFKDNGQGWINDILQLITVVGILAGSFTLIKEFIEIIEQDRFLAGAGAQEVSSAKGKAASQLQSGQKNVQATTKQIKKIAKNRNVNDVIAKTGVGIKSVVSKMTGRFKGV